MERRYWENTQLERIERLIEAAERSQGRSHSSSNNCNGIRPCPEQKPSRCREFTDRYNALLAQLAGETGGDRQGESNNNY